MSLILGDCIEKMRELDECSVDAIVTDPPYGIRFMGKAWDGAEIVRDAARAQATRARRPASSPTRPNRNVPPSSAFGEAQEAGAYDFSLTGNRAFQSWCEAWATEALRVLKPGGHALVFGGTRTYHRLACGLEDAGFEIRDCIAWMFGSGFPKSLDVSKAIDKAAGAEREIVETIPDRWAGKGNVLQRSTQDERDEAHITAPATPDAERWQGWGTALKPAHEPIVVARKPLAGTVAANVLEHGTGAINVDGCRIEAAGRPARVCEGRSDDGTLYGAGLDGSRAVGETDLGRWPANVVLDDEAAALLDEQAPDTGGGGFCGGGIGDGMIYGAPGSGQTRRTGRVDANGGASRFFYCAKTSRAERNAGLDGFDAKALNWSSGERNPGSFQAEGTDRSARNHHPTVKPIALMRWLVRLVTPPGGTVLDPFLGSGTTGIAAALEGFEFVGIEREPDYLAIAEARIAFWREHGEEGLRIVAARDAAERVRQEVAAAGQLDLLGEVAAS